MTICAGLNFPENGKFSQFSWKNWRFSKPFSITPQFLPFKCSSWTQLSKMCPFFNIFQIFIAIWSYVQASIFSENVTFPMFFTEKRTFHRVYRYNPTFLRSNCLHWTHNFKMGASLEISSILTEIWIYVQALFFQKMAHFRIFTEKNVLFTEFIGITLLFCTQIARIEITITK